MHRGHHAALWVSTALIGIQKISITKVLSTHTYIHTYIHTYNSQDTHANTWMNTVEYQLFFSFFSSMVSTTRVDMLSTTILTIFKSLISSMRIQGNTMADAQNLRNRVNFLVAFSKSRKGSLPSSFTRTCSINLTDSGICIGQTHFFKIHFNILSI